MDSWSERQYRLDDLMPLIREQLALGKKIRFSPKGTSMLPMLRQGVDSVILSPAPKKLQKYDLPLYQRDSGQYVLHRVVRSAETYTCIGDNQFDLESGVRHDQIIAVVTAFYRKDRCWSVDAWGYRCYCALWHYSRPVRHFVRRGIGWLRRKLQ